MEPTTTPTAPTVTEDITGLPVHEPAAPTPAHGTVAEMLQSRKADKKKEVKPEDQAKETKLDEVDQKLRDMLFKGRKKAEKPAEAPAKVEEPATPPAPETPKPVAEEPKPAPAKAPAKKAVVKDRAAELRERELALEQQRIEIEREKLELEKSKSKPAQQQIKVEGLDHLSPDERYELEVFHVMAKLDPAKHGELPKRFTDVASATAKYKAKWEQEHPGEAFNSEDSDHDAFFEKNQVRYDRKDFKRAEHKLATEGDVDPKVQELEKTNRELLAKHKVKELEPVIMNTWASHLDVMIESISPDILKVARTGREKLLADYPVEGEEILRAAEALQAFSKEAFQLLEGDGLFAPDPSNRLHGRILDVIRRQEQMIPSQPRENRLDPDGRDFATWAQWAAMSPSQQANHWHLGANEVLEIISKDLGARVKYEIDRLDKLAESRIKRSQPKADAATIKEKAPEHKSPAASPGSAGKSSVDTTSKATTPESDKLSKIIRTGLFKRPS